MNFHLERCMKIIYNEQIMWGCDQNSYILHFIALFLYIFYHSEVISGYFYIRFWYASVSKHRFL